MFLESQEFERLKQKTDRIQIGNKAQLNCFGHQVAGHFNEVILSSICGTKVYKPLIKTELFYQELKFYETVDNFSYSDVSNSSSDASSSSSAAYSTNTTSCLKRFIARYDGVYVDMIQASTYSHPFLFLILENLTSSYCNPSICDLKVGLHTYAPTASLEKISRQHKKYAYQSQIGFRISGMKVYNILQQDYIQYDKFIGRTLTPSTILLGIAKYFDNGIIYRRDAVIDIIQEIELLYQWVLRQTQFHFYSTSLLLIYEGGNGGNSDGTNRKENRNLHMNVNSNIANHNSHNSIVSNNNINMGISNNNNNHCHRKAIIKLIDFAHTTTNESTVDDNFLCGLQKLLQLFYQLLDYVV